jgi:hypothetical protein
MLESSIGTQKQHDVSGNGLRFPGLGLHGAGEDGVPDMKNLPHFEPVAWWWTRKEIGRELSEHYEVAKELPPTLLTLVKKLDDRDWLFPGVSRQDDVDLLGGRVRG